MDYRRRSFIKKFTLAGVTFSLPHWAQAAEQLIADADTDAGQHIVTISLDPEPAVLSAFANTGGTTVLVSPKVLEGLLEYDHQLNPAAQLATDWSISDEDRKSTRLNSSHVANSYAVFCLKKKIKTKMTNNDI